jgi:DUF1680 family protein
MMRLADYLYRWSGEAGYADYVERNLYNGVLAQQHPSTGMVAYFLPLRAGGRKLWGHPTWDFWCCHGTLVQAHSRHNAYTFYRADDGVDVCQYVPSVARCGCGGAGVTLTLTTPASLAHDERSAGPRHHPESLAVRVTVQSERPAEFALRVRLPWWLAGRPVVRVNGQDEAVSSKPAGFHSIRRVWHQDTVELDLPRAVTACALDDEPGTVAFMDGPVVLAGLCDEERTLVGEVGDPPTLLVRANEREWGRWQMSYRTRGQDHGLRLVPLYRVTDEPYAVYFPIRPPAGLDSAENPGRESL